MLISLHHLLFVVLPVALTARAVIKPRPDVLELAKGVMRFCLGVAKWVLLVSPLWHLSMMVSRGGPDSFSTSVAWMGFLALMLSLHFVFTAAGDLIAGFGGMLGFKVADEIQEIFTLRRVTQGKYVRLLPLLIVLTMLVLLLQTMSFGGMWLHLKTLFVSPPKTVATVFQESRVWTDFHVVTMLAALACFIGLPHSKDFLRVPLPWKASVCLPAFFLAMLMLWTRVAPIS